MDNTEHEEVFTEDPDSWPYIFSYPLYISCLLAFLIPLAVPLIGKMYFPKEYEALGKNQSLLNSLPGSTLHAIVVSCITFYLLLTGGMGDNYVFSKSQLGFIVMEFSLGYFVGDFFFCLSDEQLRGDKFLLTHHVASIIGVFLCLYKQGQFMFFVVFRLIAECSTPFVNSFHVLKMFNRRDTPQFTVISLTMVVVFFLCRIAPSYWLWKHFILTLMSPESALIKWYFRLWTVLTYLAFDGLNFVWFGKMAKGCFTFFTKGVKEAVQ